jgi:hypothetical protein
MGVAGSDSLRNSPAGLPVGELRVRCSGMNPGSDTRPNEHPLRETIVDAKTILPRLLTTPEFIPPVLGGLALAGMLAAILSTMGPVNFAIVTILLCALANRLHWFSVDTTYGAVGSALLVILLVKLYERLTGVEKADPSALQY